MIYAVTSLIVAVVTLAGLGGYCYFVHVQGHSGSPTIADGPTFYQALSSVNSSVKNHSGGPWSIFSVLGIAAQGPYSPGVKGYVSFNASVPINGCQAALAGLTMFNGSIPVFTGMFNSGTAPFWQFAYYSNTTGEVLVGTNVMGVPHIFAPFALRSSCTGAWGDFGLNPTYWANQIDSNSSLPPNSPKAASEVWSHVDSAYLDRHQPLVELFTSGPAMLSGTQDLPYGRLGVDFVSCGLAGFTGYQGKWPVGYGMAYYSGVSKNGSFPGGAFNATTNCYLGNAATVPGAITGAYQLQFSNATTSSATATAWVQSSMSVNFALAGGGEYTDMWGLANWMVSLNLTDSSGQSLAPGASGCPTWVAHISDCQAKGSGWYVIALSAGGEWINSYGAVPGGGTGWSEPVTALVSYQQLVIVVPSSWNVSGDRLTLNSTISSATVAGTISL